MGSSIEYVQSPLDDDLVHQLLFKGFKRVGKHGEFAEQVRATREELSTALGVPIDICMVNDTVQEDLSGMDGLTIVGRHYIRPDEWYLGNMKSAHITRKRVVRKNGGTP